MSITIQAKLSAIYRASHDELPARATMFSHNATDISRAIDPMVREIAVAGNHRMGSDLGDLAVELFIHLRKMVDTLNDSAEALDKIADRFVECDTEAQVWMSRHKQYLGDPRIASNPMSPEV